LVDASGASWNTWTDASTVQNEWINISLDYSSANIDLTAVVAINVAQWNSGVYLFSDFVLVEPTPEPTPEPFQGLAIANPTSGLGGSNAAVTIVNDDEKGKDVVSLEVLNSGDVGNAYASIVFEATDFTAYDGLLFDVLDTQGVNTVNVTLVDASGASWNTWTDASTVQNEWINISLDYSSANIDLTAVVAINVAQWNSGVYLFSDFVLETQAPE
ncbi:MAG: hypothetical protein COA42_01050, partial [Alteromonadaceae bacterium]